jgi:DNA-directed RNA polymerase subunit beta
VCDAVTGEILDMPSLESSGLGEKLTESKFHYMFAPPEPGRDYMKLVPPEERVALPLTNDRTEFIPLRKFKRSNQGTLINHRVRVAKNQVVVKGDLLADSASTSDGELALGRNVLVAFMPWRGYNFEDAILVSEKLLKDDSFTSVHIEKHECEARQTKLGPEKITREITGLPEEYIEKNLDERGIIRVGAEVKASDVLVGKITPKGESDLSGEEKLIRAVFGDKGKGYKNTPLKVPHGQEGVVIDTQYFSRKEGNELQNNIQELARVFIAKKRTLKVGDKMAGRHGNKGVVSMILPEEDMPFLADGTTIEVVLNPLGVPSRMNIGQVLETHLGLACSMFERKDADEVTRYLQTSRPIPFDRSKQDVDVKVPRITFAPASTPLLVQTPVFKSVSEDDIRKLFTRLDIPLDGKTELFDGVTGEKFKERVMVGVMYVMKLNHLVDDKMHARSTGSYALITQQPLGGKAQFGGQRLGEMEVWALEGYGAAYLLKEMLTVKSDDVNGRNRTYKAIVDGKVIPEPGIPESFNVMVNELRSLALDVQVEAGAAVPTIFLEEEDKDLRPTSLIVSDIIPQEEDLGEDIL